MPRVGVLAQRTRMGFEMYAFGYCSTMLVAHNICFNLVAYCAIVFKLKKILFMSS